MENSFKQDLNQNFEENRTQLSFLEKFACVFSGPILGLLPPEVQMKLGKITRNDYQAATLMSLSSRLLNMGVGLYGSACVVGRLFGVDIDPTPMNALTWAGLPFAFDSFLREFMNGLEYSAAGGSLFRDYNVPWGEPIISILNSK